MKDPSSAQAALTTPFHLACVSGPDRGAVIGLSDGVEIGRTGAPLVDPALSRRHCCFHAAEKAGVIGELVDRGARNPLRNRWHRSRRPSRVTLRLGTRVRLGGSVWVVRTRPTDLHWPIPPPARKGFLANRWLHFLPFLTIVIVIFRFASMDPRILAGLIASVATAIWAGAGWMRLRRARRFDPAFLQLAALSRLNDKRTGAVSSSPALATTPGPDLRIWRGAVGGRTVTIRADDWSIGVVGAGAAAYARWIAAQIWMMKPQLLWTPDPSTCDGLGPCLWMRGGPASIDAPLPAGSIQVCWAPTVEGLPPQTSLILTPIKTSVSERWMSEFSAVPAADGTAELPLAVGLQELDGLDLSAEATERRWSSFSEREAPWSVPVGICRGSMPGHTEVFHLDLTAMGPHALLAGGTGSGKSAALQVWLRSLAIHVPPGRLRMVLFDYKGGAGLAPLATLPHVELLATDLDIGALSWQLRHLKNVLLRRKRLLAEEGFADIVQWEAASAATAPPRLLVVIDEFQALAEEHPRLLGVITRLAAQGRSLGLHLLLSTQRPGPAVTPDLRATVDLRVTLHCAEAADSITVRDDDLASRLPRQPGRALVGEIELQFALSSDPAFPAVKASTGTVAAGALWPLPLPREIDADELPSGTDTGSGIAVAVQENPLPGRPLLPLRWTGSPLLIAGPAITRVELTRTARLIGGLVASRLGLPSCLIGSHPDPDYPWSQQISPTQTSRAAHFLSRVLGLGPMVLVIEDLGGLLREFDFHGAAIEAAAAWDRLVSGATRTGIQLLVVDVEGTPRASRAPTRLLRLPDAGVWAEPSMARLIPAFGESTDGILDRTEAVSRVSGRFLAVGFSHAGTPLDPTMVQAPTTAAFPTAATIPGSGAEPRRLPESVVIVGNPGQDPPDFRAALPKDIRWQDRDRWLTILQSGTPGCVILLEPCLEATRYLAARSPHDALWLKAGYPFAPGSGVLVEKGAVRPFDAYERIATF